MIVVAMLYLYCNRVSLSVEDAQNGSLHILYAHAHGNYVVLAGADELAGGHSR